MFGFIKKLIKKNKKNEKYINTMYSRALRDKNMKEFEIGQYGSMYFITKFNGDKRVVVSKHKDFLSAKEQFVEIYKNLKGESNDN